MEENGTRAFFAIIRGRVQGVGFRYSTLYEAQKLGLVGYVRNAESRDQVEVYAEGPVRDLEDLAAWLEIGPPGARVESIHLENRSPGSYWASFVVEYD